VGGAASSKETYNEGKVCPTGECSAEETLNLVSLESREGGAGHQALVLLWDGILVFHRKVRT